jgi:conjugal transfer pilus assembly protein TrbC
MGAFKLRTLFMALAITASFPLFANEQAVVTDDALNKAKLAAQEALKKVSPAKDIAPVTKMDLSKIPAPLVHYDGNLVTSSVKVAGYDKNAPMASIEPQKKLMVFISFSMPKESIGRYIEQANRIGRDNIKIALIGLDESNNLRKTAARISGLTKGKDVEVVIDPNAFERFGIKQVPALVVYKDDPVYAATCAIQGKQDEVKDMERYLSVYGDVSIDYALDYLVKHNKDSEFSGYMTKLIADLRGNER